MLALQAGGAEFNTQNPCTKKAKHLGMMHTLLTIPGLERSRQTNS